MKKINITYTIEKHNIGWIVWENMTSEHGCGCFQVFTAKTKKACKEFCDKNNIKISKP